MVGIAQLLPPMTEIARDRLARAMATIAPVEGFDALPDLLAKRDELLAFV